MLFPSSTSSRVPAAESTPASALPRKGRGHDFATGKSVNLFMPEEKVRQEYERILHEDLGYPKSLMDIEVPVQMGSTVKLADIAVYNDQKPRRIVGIVETKAPGISKGKAQLRSYMSAVPSCTWGVWTNGNSFEYAFKRAKTGDIVAETGFSIPRYGEESASIRSMDDLHPARNLKSAFREINNLIYANAKLVKTEKQGAEMVRLIFCKLYDEEENRIPKFQVKQDEPLPEMRKRLEGLWKKTRESWLGGDIFSGTEKLMLDNKSLAMVVRRLQGFALQRTDRDVIGDAFEVFSERQFAGEKGQFFTPRTVVKMAVSMVDPQPEEKIMDPACGSGGFLIHALSHVWENMGKGASHKKRMGIAGTCFFGSDKDIDLVRICKAHMCLMGDGRSNIVHADSLNEADWNTAANNVLRDSDSELLQYDVIVTNPPFGSKIKVVQEEVLHHYALGHKWVEMASGKWEQTDKIKDTPPQVLFVERCLNMLKDGGRMAIILPDGMLGNKGDGYIRQFISERADILAVVDCPTETFLPHTGTKTSVLVLQKSGHKGKNAAGRKFFAAIAEKCGHTARGYPIYRDREQTVLDEDFSEIAQKYLTDNTRGDRFFRIGKPKNGILVPRYYDPRVTKRIAELRQEKGVEFKTLGELEEEKQLEVGGVGKSPTASEMSSEGEYRFIRTADLGNFELRDDTKRKVDEAVFELYRHGQDLRPHDILFVKDGGKRIGDCVILLEDDLNCLIQGHFNRIRALDKGIDPFLLFHLLNTDIVKRQIRQRVFSQTTLSSIGGRIRELALPIPKRQKRRQEVAAEVRKMLQARRKSLANLWAI